MKNPYIIQLKELQFRGFYLFFGFFLNFILCYIERANLVQSVIYPLKKSFPVQNSSLEFSSGLVGSGSLDSPVDNFVYLSLTEAFSVQIYLAFMGAVFLSIPLFWIQSQFFICSALYQKEQEILKRIIVISQILLISFIFFTQKYILPQAYSFFIGFGFGGEESTSLSQLPSFGSQVYLFLDIVFAMILTSQFPILFFLVFHWGWIRPSFLIKSRPFFILFFLTWSALISPPDLISQLIIFLPTFFFQEVSIFLQIFFSIYIEVGYREV